MNNIDELVRSLSSDGKKEIIRDLLNLGHRVDAFDNACMMDSHDIVTLRIIINQLMNDCKSGSDLQ